MWEVLQHKCSIQIQRYCIQTIKKKGLSYFKTRQGKKVVLMDRHTYNDKCFELLSMKQFTMLTSYPKKTLESKVRRTLGKIKSKFIEQEYKKLYPTGSLPIKFYGIAKIHKIPVNGNTDPLPIRPIVCRINTTTYNIVRYYSKLQKP